MIILRALYEYLNTITAITTNIMGIYLYQANINYTAPYIVLNLLEDTADKTSKIRIALIQISVWNKINTKDTEKQKNIEIAIKEIEASFTELYNYSNKNIDYVCLTKAIPYNLEITLSNCNATIFFSIFTDKEVGDC